MNNATSFQIGWAAFACGTLGGAFIGYQRAVAGQDKRAAALAGQVQQRNDSLDKLEAKMRAEGSRHFRPPSAATIATETTDGTAKEKKKVPP